jgi:hypothetical protein
LNHTANNARLPRDGVQNYERHVDGAFFGRDGQMIAELRSPCDEFQVVAFRIYGRDMFEAVRVAGEGSLYSVATGDLAELHAALDEACGGNCG